MDATELLILESEIAYSVLGRGDDFMLVDNADPIAVANAVASAPMGFTYCGVVALKSDGCPALSYEPHVECVRPMMLAALAFCRLIAARIKPNIGTDAVAWLNALHVLPDPR